MNQVTRTLPVVAALLVLAGAAHADERISPHLTVVLAAGLEGRRVSGDTVAASSLGGTARAFASLFQRQDDGAVLHTDMFGELGDVGGRWAGATGVDFGFGVKVPLQGPYGGFFRLGTRAEHAGDRAATLSLFTFPRLEIGGLATTRRLHVEATVHGGLALGSFSPAIVVPSHSPPSLPDFATSSHRPLGPGMWGAALRVRTPYAYLDAKWDRFEPSPKAAGRVDSLEARACAGHWLVACGHGGFVRGPVLVPFRGSHEAQLVTFGVSLGVGRALDATTGVFQ